VETIRHLTSVFNNLITNLLDLNGSEYAAIFAIF